MTEALSPTQQRIFDLLMTGLTSKEVARKLQMSYRTVETHRIVIYRKKGVRNFLELLRKMAGAA